MNYNFMSSLEQLAVVRTAIMLWNLEDNKVVLMKKFSSEGPEEVKKVWRDVEDKIIEKVRKHHLPTTLENKLIDIIKPIGIEMFKWSVYHESFLRTDMEFVRKGLNKLCWTAEGTVDRRKTAEILINDENLKISYRYKLACIYCLEHDIPKLWNKMSGPSQMPFLCLEPEIISHQHDLVTFWTYYIKGEVSKVKDMVSKRYYLLYKLCNISLYQNYPLERFLFETATITSKSATEYFFNKLTCEDEEALLEKTAESAARRCFCPCKYMDHPYQCNGDVFSYLLSQMNDTSQIRLLRVLAVQKCLLDGPFQRFFEEKAIHITLTTCEFLDILKRLTNKMVSGFRDYNYHKLFREVWLHNNLHENIDLKLIFENGLHLNFILKLLMVDDKENVELILNDTTSSQRENDIFSSKAMEICKSLISADKCDSLKFFIQKCLPPCKEAMINLKTLFKNYIESGRIKEGTSILKKFFKFVDHIAPEIMKGRSKEEENCNPAKRLRKSAQCKYIN